MAFESFGTAGSVVETRAIETTDPRVEDVDGTEKPPEPLKFDGDWAIWIKEIRDCDQQEKCCAVFEWRPLEPSTHLSEDSDPAPKSGSQDRPFQVKEKSTGYVYITAEIKDHPRLAQSSLALRTKPGHKPDARPYSYDPETVQALDGMPPGLDSQPGARHWKLPSFEKGTYKKGKDPKKWGFCLTFRHIESDAQPFQLRIDPEMIVEPSEDGPRTRG